MPRLFVALRPDQMTRDALIAAMDGIAGARWQSDAQLHLTLSFLGQTNDALMPDIDDALRMVRAKPLALSIKGVGHFEDNGRPTAVWAAAEPRTELKSLAAAVRHALWRAGAPNEDGTFVPHITLARLKRSSGPIADFLSARAMLATTAAPVTHFSLYESILSEQGAQYRAIADYPLTE